MKPSTAAQLITSAKLVTKLFTMAALNSVALTSDVLTYIDSVFGNACDRIE